MLHEVQANFGESRHVEDFVFHSGSDLPSHGGRELLGEPMTDLGRVHPSEHVVMVVDGCHHEVDLCGEVESTFDILWRMESLIALDQLLPQPEQNPSAQAFLIDPNGMLMMGYTEQHDSKAILKDLELLLKATQNWNKGANHDHG